MVAGFAWRVLRLHCVSVPQSSRRTSSLVRCSPAPQRWKREGVSSPPSLVFVPHGTASRRPGRRAPHSGAAQRRSPTASAARHPPATAAVTARTAAAAAAVLNRISRAMVNTPLRWQPLRRQARRSGPPHHAQLTRSAVKGICAAASNPCTHHPSRRTHALRTAVSEKRLSPRSVRSAYGDKRCAYSPGPLDLSKLSAQLTAVLRSDHPATPAVDAQPRQRYCLPACASEPYLHTPRRALRRLPSAFSLNGTGAALLQRTCFRCAPSSARRATSSTYASCAARIACRSSARCSCPSNASHASCSPPPVLKRLRKPQGGHSLLLRSSVSFPREPPPY
jgi:hypothetical protein